MVTPVLKVYVPTWLMPTSGEVAIVAPVMVQVRVLTPQLSPVTALGTTTDALHTPASSFCDMFAGQVTVGAIVSIRTAATALSTGVVQPVPVLVIITL